MDEQTIRLLEFLIYPSKQLVRTCVLKVCSSVRSRLGQKSRETRFFRSNKQAVGRTDPLLETRGRIKKENENKKQKESTAIEKGKEENAECV